jgi:phosphatidylglycerophosphatase A
MKMRLVRMLTSFFYVGYAPFWPGCFGSAAGLAVLHWTDPVSAAILLILFSAVGFVLCEPSRTAFSSDDPKPFVLDEVAGMMLSVLFLPKSIFIYAAGFIIFRILDVVKPWFIGRIQNQKGAWSIMADDLAAGFLTNCIVRGLWLAKNAFLS